jgi:hypothetical protein
MTTKQVTMDVPLALQNLIIANNKLLKTYQAQLMQEVQEANAQMMNILQLSPEAGWKLDIDNMVYVRPEEPPAPLSMVDDASVVG